MASSHQERLELLDTKAFKSISSEVVTHIPRKMNVSTHVVSCRCSHIFVRTNTPLLGYNTAQHKLCFMPPVLTNLVVLFLVDVR